MNDKNEKSSWKETFAEVILLLGLMLAIGFAVSIGFLLGLKLFA